MKNFVRHTLRSAQQTRPVEYKSAIPTRLASLKARKWLFPVFAGVALLLGAILTSAVADNLPHETSTTNPALDAGKMALSFEPNDGQTSAATRFIARAPGSTIYFSPSDVAIEVQSAAPDGEGQRTKDKSAGGGMGATASLISTAKYEAVEASVLSPRPPKPQDLEQSRASSTTVRMQFIGANSAPEMTAADMLPGKVNYLIGSDPERWHANLPTYAGVVYHGLYPGIDLKYEGTASDLKGTYTLAPGADPAHIRWSYEVPNTKYRVPSVTVDDGGNLQISVDKVNGTRHSVLSEQAPVAWQEIDGRRRLVSAQYSVGSDGRVGFALGAYDHSHALIIDPTLTYSTYFGGIIADQPWGMALDSSGNSYIAGYTASDNFPSVNALQPVYGGQGDAFVVKFNSAGVPVYSTYLGGDYLDYGNDVAVDAAGNAYVTGWTGSTDFPLHNAFQPTYMGNWDGFVSKLSPDGSSLVYSTYLGGTSIENADGIAVDPAGNAYITGDTQSGDFPTHNAYQPQHAGTGSTDVFVTKFDASGQALIYSTFLGGSSGGETGLAITADAGGYGYITGFTTSSNFPIANAYQPACYPGAAGCWDAFVTRFSPDGQSLVYSTYLGGNDIEYVDKGAAITTDGTGTAYVTGFSGSTNFPLINAFQSYGGQIDVFLSKFSGAGALTYSTYLGGTNSDVGGAIALDFLGNIYVGGETLSEDFPVVNAIQPTMGGFEDAFVTKFNANGQSLSYSTFLGGSNNREEYGIIGIGVDGSGTAYLAGSTSATDFPTTANAYQPFNNGSYDIFFAKISDPIGPTPTRTNTPAGTATPTPTVCAVGDYTITQSTGATIVPGTTLLPNSNCNDCTAPFVLPFPVQFYNQTFTQARASSNGNLQFTGDNALPFNSCLPNDTYNNTIYAYWDDLFLDCLGSGGCGIYTSVSGTAPNRIFNVEWRAHRNEPPVVVINFEIRLYENSNGRFDIIYGQVDNPGDTATVGVQRDTGSRVTQFSCNQGVLTQGLQLTFTLPPCQSPSQTPTPAGTGTATNTPVAMPTLAFSTYFGAFERDSIDDIGQDAAGNIYVAGTTFEFDIDYGDIMVAKFTPDCQTLLWRRVIGGTRIDYGYALAVDAAGNATVAGIATSFDYPTLNPLQANHAGGIYDAVLTKLNPQGSTIFSTYLGGSGTDYGDSLATDEAGNVYLTGHTNSSNFPTTSGAFQTSNQGMYDGYVTKVNSTGSAITWSTYLGGMYSDESHAVALDAQNNVYLTGLTVSPNFPMMNPFQSTIGDTSGDAFVTKMNSTGSALLYSTYLGGGNPPGPGEDNGQGITVDSQGYAYVTGYTQSPNFPTTPGSYQPFFRGYNDAFVTKLVPAGNGLVYSTFIGGSLNPPYGDDDAYDIAVDALGQAHITGKTYSPDFPVVNAVQPTPGDVYDGFVSKLNAAGSALLYSTFLGGDYQLPDFDGEDAGAGIYIDNLGNAVIGGGTSSYNFPVVNAYQPANAGMSDGFISKIAVPGPAGTPTVTRTAPPATASVPPSTTTTTASPTRTVTAVASGTVAVSTRTATPSATGTVTACTIQFTDVPPGSTFYTWIRCLACEGIINGYPDGTFRPNNSVTRGQLAKIVSNAAGFIEPVTGHTFQDVLPGSTFYDYVGRLASRNIVQGYPCGGPGEPCVPPTNLPYFRPNSGVTRGQTSKIVAIAANLPAPAPGTQSFEDVPPGSTFWPWIEALAAQGVISGYPCGSVGEPCVPPGNRPYFRPSVGMTRGQASKVVSSVFLPGCQAGD